MEKNNVVVVLLLDISLLILAVGETSTNEDGLSNIELISIESVPLSVIEEIDSMSWSSSYIDNNLAQENSSSYGEVDQDSMNLYFSVGPDSGLDLEALQDEVLTEIGELLGSDQSFATASLIACTREDLVMYLQLRYTNNLDYEHQKKVIKTIYDAVEVDGSLGKLNVFHLYVQNTQGSYVRIDDICDFEGCPSGITCVSTELQCIWNCSLNFGYCPEKSECIDKQTNGFYCRIDHDTEYVNTTNAIPTSKFGSPWSSIVTITGSILVCVFVVCITVKVLHVYYRKQSATCHNHHQRVIDFENNSITTDVNEIIDTVDMRSEAEFQYLLPMESDLTTLIQNGNSLPNLNGDISNTFLLVDNHEHF